MTLPSQNGGIQPTDTGAPKPEAEDWASSPIKNVVSCDPKRTWICRCGIETDMRCSRCGLPICDLNARECAWHYCQTDKEKRDA